MQKALGLVSITVVRLIPTMSTYIPVLHKLNILIKWEFETIPPSGCEYQGISSLGGEKYLTVGNFSKRKFKSRLKSSNWFMPHIFRNEPIILWTIFN
jgi:hypothetical protein